MNTTATLSPVERLLNMFTEVRQGEAASALMLALNIFLILTAYYILKPVREALILSGSGGAEIKSYVAAGQTLRTRWSDRAALPTTRSWSIRVYHRTSRASVRTRGRCSS